MCWGRRELLDVDRRTADPPRPPLGGSLFLLFFKIHTMLRAKGSLRAPSSRRCAGGVGWLVAALLQSMSLKDAVSALRSLKAELEASRAAKGELENAYRGVLEVRDSGVLYCRREQVLSAEPFFCTVDYSSSLLPPSTAPTGGRGAMNRHLDADVFSLPALICYLTCRG